MKVFSADQIRAIDKYTIENEPIQSVDLMERAAQVLARWIRNKLQKKQYIVLFAGPGNNGGDAWALARILFHHGYENIRFYLLGDPDNISVDSGINRKRLIEETDIRINLIQEEKDFPYIAEEDCIIDGLFGSGLSRPLEGLIAELVSYINESKNAGVISIDIPSGLYCNNANLIDQLAIKAKFTLTFQFPKEAFFYAENEQYVGIWEILPIGLHDDIITSTATELNYLTENDVSCLVKKRSKFSHKGSCGHALIVAGSYGMMGAAVLSVNAAVRGGAGLVTSHIPRLGYQIIQTTVPEALVILDESDLICTEVNDLERYSAIAIGPGLNTKSNTVKALEKLLQEVQVPFVLDADALNILSQNKDLMKMLGNNKVLTPHPGEFDRLTKKHDSHSDRVQSQRVFSKEYETTVILKGAHTSISFPNGSIWFNSSGNPGMATGGSGDVLTGLLCSLLAQHYTIEEATKLAVYLHGKAGDIALKQKGYHGLIASDIIENIAKAFKKLEPINE